MHSQTLLLMERGWRPNVELSPTCPRCGSSNTKFCYYNNYSLTQPRYFCKGCRRYWTKGGSLRNIPVGGGCRKNRRGKSLRLSTDFMSSRTTGFRTVPPDHPLGLSHGSSSSANPPDIDLALVYANFLNPQPPSSNTGNRSEPREASSSNSGPSLQNLRISSGMTDGTDSSVGLLVEAGNGLFEWESLSYLFPDALLIKDSNQNSSTPIFDPLQAVHHSMPMQPCGNEDANSYVLPPLPNDDVVVSQEVTASWSMLNDYSLRAPEQPALGPDHHQVQAEDPNLPTIVTYREFDFPGEHTLPRK